MSHYDSWKTATPDDDGPIPGNCPVCDGGDGAACSEECDELISRIKTRRAIRGAYEACRIAISRARGYEAEGDSVREPRIRAVLDEVGAYRRFIRAMRVCLSLQTEDIGSMDTLPAPAAQCTRADCYCDHLRPGEMCRNWDAVEGAAAE